MKMNSTNDSASNQRIYNGSASCKVIPSPNSTIRLAQNWENVPETCLLYSLFGILLFILFLVFTYRAWSRNYTREDSINMGIVDFLYGYRDPDQWYIIPRLEFVRREDRRHKHDMGNSNIYLPPKLPLANPIELIADDDDDDVHSTVDESKGKQQARQLNTIDSPKKKEQGFAPKDSPNMKTALKSPISPKSPVDITSIPSGSHLTSHATDSTGSFDNSSSRPTTPSLEPREIANQNIIIPSHVPQIVRPFKTPAGTPKPSPLGQAFFYPSILTAEQLQASYICRVLNRFFARFFKVTDADIIYTKGIDAYEYLLFQRHLILIMFVTTVLCVCVILPVHWFSGELISPDGSVNASFQATTIKNVNENSNWYLIHIICSLVIFFVSIITLKSYRDSTILKNGNGLSRRTLLIGNIPVEQRNRPKLAQIFKEFFSKSFVTAIQFVYRTSDLDLYQGQLDVAIKAKEYCSYYRKKNGKDFMVKPSDVNEERICSGMCRTCSCCYICCCQWPRENSIPGTIYYSQREAQLRELIKKSLEHSIKHPSECAFVTFKTHRQAKRVFEILARLKEDTLYAHVAVSNVLQASKQHNIEINQGSKNSNGSGRSNDPLDPKNNPHVRSIRLSSGRKFDAKGKIIERPRIIGLGKDISVNTKDFADIKGSSTLGPIGWSARYAPHPDNVEFDDLLYVATTHTYRTVLIHVLMVIIFIFFTTPNVILSYSEKYSLVKKMKGTSDSALWQLMMGYLPTIIAVGSTGLLPVVVWHVSNQLPYEDTGSKNHSIMWKVYLFLILMVIVMPSIGMTSAQALIMSGSQSKLRSECLFPTDNGGYYINYVVSTALASNMVELLKPVEFIKYYFILLTGRSTADFEAGRQTLVREFSVSMQHTSVLLIFSVVMTYAISCPLIAPFGLLYLIIKHSIDHYNLYYTYYTKKVDQNTQKTVDTFVRCALLLMLFQTAIAIQINAGIGNLYSILSQIIFWLTCMSFFINCFCDYTSRSTTGNRRSRHQHEFCACFYLPRVFDDLLRDNAIPENLISRQQGDNLNQSIVSVLDKKR